MVGRAEFRQSPELTEGRWETSLTNVVATHSSGRRFQEPQIKLAGRGKYSRQSRAVELGQRSESKP